jgi:hypothetical protein
MKMKTRDRSIVYSTTDASVVSRLRIAIDQLKSRCAGLLKTKSEADTNSNLSEFYESSDEPADTPTGLNVRHIHWTAREYLESKIVR